MSANALGQCGPSASCASPLLLDLISDADEFVANASAAALRHIGPALERADSKVLDLLKHPDTEIRIIVANVLAPSATEAIPALSDLVRLDDWEQCAAAARALGRMGPKAASTVPALIACWKKYADSTVIAEALGLIGDAAEPAVAAFIDALDSDDSGGWLRSPRRIQAAWALGHLGPIAVAAIPALRVAAMTQTRDERELQEAAAWALMQICPSDCH